MIICFDAILTDLIHLFKRKLGDRGEKPPERGTETNTLAEPPLYLGILEASKPHKGESTPR